MESDRDRSTSDDRSTGKERGEQGKQGRRDGNILQENYVITRSERAYERHPDQDEPPPPPPPSTDEEASGEPERRRSWREALLTPSRTLVVGLVAVALVAFVGVGAGVYAAFFTGGPDLGPSQSDPPVATGERGQSGATSSPSGSFNEDKLASAKTDPKPLTLAEAFPDETVPGEDRTFERVANDLTTDCAAAGRGGFGEVLDQAGCMRVLRATFVDQNRRYVLMGGVAVLPTQAAAQRVEQAADAQRNVWFVPLSGPEGSGAELLDRSGGYSRLTAVGHYVAFSYAAYAGKINPGSEVADLAELSQRMLRYAAQPVIARGNESPESSRET